ncbi:orotidine-5'-phosphate decarboxylase [Candidatus Neomarinimicrobiota bacterium]
MTSPFNQRLRHAVDQRQSRLCLGLDLDPTRPSGLHGDDLPSLKQAAEAIVEASWEKVWGYKLNFAFFERFGAAGYRWLEEMTAMIGDRAIVIGDAKRGDIGNSARHYADAILGHLAMDAVTVNPYMGHDALEPFIRNPEKGAFVLCLTSNPGAEDFQFYPESIPLYQRVAAWAESQNRWENIGLVVGATQPEHLASIRKAAPSLPFLIPGVGAQGGSLEAAVGSGTLDVPSIVVVSRGILYAGTGSLDDISRALDDMNKAIEKAQAT